MPADLAGTIPLRTLLISVLTVIALSGFVIPTLTRIFAGWVVPARRDNQRLSCRPGRLLELSRPRAA